MHTLPKIAVRDYTYELPQERIAKYPLPERDSSRLLIWEEERISETLFSDLADHLPGNSLLVCNNSRVIHARLLFYRPSGARIEILCLEPHQPSDYQLTFQQRRTTEWKCLVGNAKRWKGGTLSMEVVVGGANVNLYADITGKEEDNFLIRFTWDQPVTFGEVIEAAGHVPIPPYLERPDEEQDKERYQTTFARIDGSVAAPTAGLHFTEEVMEKLVRKNTSLAEVTLHVGAGTFLPVKSEEVTAHRMHTETVLITRQLVRRLLDHPGKIIAVGTTSVRSLESLYWLGIQTSSGPAVNSLHVEQWEPYQDVPLGDTMHSLRNILRHMEQNNLDKLNFTTSLMIIPGYDFRIIDGMITNFHQPKSTLLLLIAAFLGPGWRKVYDYALENGFRFLSYGDSNLYIRD